MFWFKGCPRCRGDMFLERIGLGEIEAFCMQCGFRRYSLRPVEPREETVIPQAA